MRVLVLGGGRFQGLRAAEMLVEAGHSVTVANRSGTAPAGASAIAGEMENAETMPRLFGHRDYDVVVDNLAYQPDHLERLLPYLRQRTGHYVMISSVVVYHGAFLGYSPVEEARADLSSEAGGAYDVGKRRCEQVLRGVGDLPWTVLRLANVEGAGDPSNRRGFYFDRIADGGGLLIPSDHSHPFQPLWRDDAAQAVLGAAGNARAFGRTYNIAGDEIYTLCEWLGLLAEVMGMAAPYVAQLPLAKLRALLGFDYKLPLPFRPLMDITAARRDLGYQPTPAAEWLPETVAWWRGSGLQSLRGEQREAELAAIRRIRELLG